MTDEELIARLRSLKGLGWSNETADRIEALVKEVERNAAIAIRAMERATLAEEWSKHDAARAERLEEALIWCSGSADFNEGGFAREGWLKLCAPLLKGADHE